MLPTQPFGRTGHQSSRAIFGAAALTLVSSPAWAHVEVETNRAYAGAKDVTLTFHVPNEEAPATTRNITFVFPTDHPLLGVTTTSQNGFTPTETTVPLATALRGPKGVVREVVRTVEFTGGRLAGTQEKAFTFHVDQLPSDTRTLTFKVLQKYSTGTSVSWIEVAAGEAAEPEHPAPVLTLGPPRAAAQPDAGGTVAVVAVGAKAPTTAAGRVADAAGAKAPTTAVGSGADAGGAGAKEPLSAWAAGGLAVAAGGWTLRRRRRGQVRDCEASS